ncbi:hypothetical protein ACJX0J_012363, partial [Zea mays]
MTCHVAQIKYQGKRRIGLKIKIPGGLKNNSLLELHMNFMMSFTRGGYMHEL